tara:strand:+ start:103 stop:1092 length:990 start_codon:yes stop_codon:yes gene_type:complete
MKKLLLLAPLLLGAITPSFSDPNTANANDLEGRKFKQDKAMLLNLSKTLLAGDLETLTDTAINSVVEESVGISKSFLERYFPTVEIGASSLGGQKPQFNFLVVAPLSDEKDIFNTVFTQVSSSYQDNRTTLNLGIGYRKLSDNKTLLMGVNAFYDHEFPYDHGRTSLGLEARTTMWEFSANKYWATTDWKTTRDGDERALGGFDVEAGIPLPYINWATVFVKHYEWQAYEGVTDAKGQTVSLRASLPGALTGLEFEAGRTFDDTYSDESFIEVTYNLTQLFAKDKSKRQPWVSDTAYRLGSMEDRRFEKVRRSNKIVKQRKGSLTVTGF